MEIPELQAAARAAERAADRAREEILPRFRDVAVETKPDGSPVTEADREAERVIRETLGDAFPTYSMLGEEHGEERGADDAPTWVVDPIDGTIAFARGIPLFATLIALVHEGRPWLGLIDLPALGERTIGWVGGGCRRNGREVRVSQATRLDDALISHGDPFCFERAGQRDVFERMARSLPMLRGYTDAFGHAQVLAGGIDAMVDLDLNPWDAAATEVLIPEAGGRCERVAPSGEKFGLVFGSPVLVEQLMRYFDTR